MTDIVSILETGIDMGVADSVVSKAGNVIAVQLGDLEYAPDFGIDKRYFLASNFKIQPEAFRSYCIQRLVAAQVNVTSCITVLDALLATNTFFVDDPNKEIGGLIT